MPPRTCLPETSSGPDGCSTVLLQTPTHDRKGAPRGWNLSAETRADLIVGFPFCPTNRQSLNGEYE